ncbi:MAG: glutamine--tRNA ligase/YqeY domain fusion protein [Spirochaetes bacterium]|nr:glutamine--tRNA ligase/YqeY domain fusion protein [Spirochaetota bacterium]
MEETKPVHFIKEAIIEDNKTGRYGGAVVTRFPPEPNGYLHLGHAKAIAIDFGMAADFGGRCHLRMDDTNPSKEDESYVASIKRDVAWLGWSWGEHFYYGSDYFDKMYEWAIHLIREGKAYVDDLSPEEMSTYRGTLTKPGKNSPYRDRGIDENLDLFTRMKNGEFPNGARVLRAKIDMASPNMNMRDPVIYRIMKVPHYRSGDTWCIYPMYDYAHPLEDAIEGITHSLCSLEFEDHRPLYDWVIQNCPVPAKPRQIEFARFNLTYTMMSKRKLLQLVEQNVVNGWDDPRLPTIAGLRRRGYTPEALKDFCERIGVAKAISTVDLALLEHCIREDLNKRANRAMAVLNPLKVVITNYPEGKVEELETDNNPENPAAGKRKIPFSREVYIERDDFMEVPPKGFYRLSPGKEIRLKNACYITCTDVVKDAAGNVTEVHCTYDPATMGGWSSDGRKVKGTSHWVSAKHAITATVHLYENLFLTVDPDDGGDFMKNINPKSLTVITDAKLEPSLAETKAHDRVQFERLGYFCADDDSKPGALVFNRIVNLRDTWAKEKAKK